jgi:hypothetical protein
MSVEILKSIGCLILHNETEGALSIYTCMFHPLFIGINVRTPTSDTDSVVEFHDDGANPDTFKAKKRARLSHIWLPENGVECFVDGVSRWKCQRFRIILLD